MPQHSTAPKITAVILAAGQSSRMGEPKLLLPWADTTILGQTIRHTQAATADLLLVSGAYREPVEAIAADHDVPVVHNPHYAAGEMLSSLQTAVRHLQARPQPPDGVLVMLGDLPFIGPDVLRAVIAAFVPGQDAAAAPTHNGRRGHPVLLAAKLFAPLLALPPDSAPRALLRRHTDRTRLVPVDTAAILHDIDTPEQYAAAQQKRDGR